MENGNKVNLKRYAFVVILWIILIGLTSTGGSRLTNDVDSSAQFIDPDTESGKGFLLIEDRFQQVEDVIHIIVLNFPSGSTQSITDPEWRNFSRALTILLLDQFFLKGYPQVFSEAYLLFQASQTNDSIEQAEYQNFASSLVSDDGKTGLINMITNQYDFEKEQEILKEHVLEIRDLVQNKDLIYQIAQTLGIPSNALPSDIAFAELEILVTGQVANFVDLLRVSEDTFDDSELIAVLVVLVILTLVFRSPMGIVIPIIGMVASLFPTYMLTYLLAKNGVFPVSDFLPSTIAMIGIAVAVDYNLFSLVRYREEFRKRRAKLELEKQWTHENIIKTQVEAAKVMNKTAGQAVMYSGATVIIGFSSILIIGSEFTMGMAIGVSIVVAFSVLSARSLTPGILSLFGRFLDWPNVISRASQDVERQKDHEKHKENELSGAWVRWSKLVMKFPIAFLLVGLLIMTPFIITSSQTVLSFDSLKNLPPGVESREGFEIVTDKFNLGQFTPFMVVIDAGNKDNSALNQNIFNGVIQLGQWALDPSIPFQGVASLNMQINQSNGQIINLALNQVEFLLQFDELFQFNAANFLNLEHGNNTLIVELYANMDQGTSDAWKLAEALAKKSDEIFGNINEVENSYVTGLAAAFNDTSDAMYAKVPLMILVAVILIYISLLVLFRSVILPAKAILTIGGSILFGLGSLVFIFQHGNLLNITLAGTTIWETEQTTGLMFFMPIFIFTTILGLGMDYSIFIISRIKEEYDNGDDISHAVGIGLAKTAGVVTSAATIMTATFMVFALSPLLVLKTFGLALSIGIVVDATISRIILLPAAMKLAGKWNWYLPKWLKRILPDLKLEH